MKNIHQNRICSVGRALEELGDKWVLLILREAFFGVRHFDEFQANLGIATNILSNRLKRLVEHKIMKKEKDEKDARRVQYSLTKKGADLYDVTLALMNWGDRWLADEDGPPLILTHRACGRRLKAEMRCAHCGERAAPFNVDYEDGPAIKKAALEAAGGEDGEQ